MVTPLTPQVLSLLFPGTKSAAKQFDILSLNTFKILDISQERLREETQHEQPNLRKALGHASIIDGISELLCIDTLPVAKDKSQLDQPRCHPREIGKNEFYNRRPAPHTLQKFGDHYEEEPISDKWLEDRTIKLSADGQNGSLASSGKVERSSDDKGSCTSDCCDDDFQSLESSDDDSNASESSEDDESQTSECSDDADESFTEILDQKIDLVVELNDRTVACSPERAKDDAQCERGLRLLLLGIATATSGAVCAYNATHSS